MDPLKPKLVGFSWTLVPHRQQITCANSLALKALKRTSFLAKCLLTTRFSCKRTVTPKFPLGLVFGSAIFRIRMCCGKPKCIKTYAKSFDRFGETIPSLQERLKSRLGVVKLWFWRLRSRFETLVALLEVKSLFWGVLSCKSVMTLKVSIAVL